MADMEYQPKELESSPEGSSGGLCPWCGSKKGLSSVKTKELDEEGEYIYKQVCKDCMMPRKETSATVDNDLEEEEIPYFDPDRLDEYPEEEDSEWAGFF